MIRQHKVKTSTWNAKQVMSWFHTRSVSSCWIQQEPVDSKLVSDWISSVVGHPVRGSIILHKLTGGAEEHVDYMSKNCIVIPLILPKKCPIYLWENEQIKHLKKGFYYTFNDYNPHGIAMGDGEDGANDAKVCLVTCDNLPRNRRG